MLTEYPVTPGKKEEFVTRWFSDSYADLYVWYDAAGSIAGFQLCYNKDRDEHSLTWKRGSGYAHNSIDAGDDTPLSNQTPIVVPDGLCPLDTLRGKFISRAAQLPPEVRACVLDALDPARHPELLRLI